MTTQIHPAHYEFDNTIKGVCERVTVYLNDSEPGYTHARWSEALVKSAVKDSLYILMQLASSSLSTLQKFYLSDDSCVQSLPDGCDKIISIECITDEVTCKDLLNNTVAEDTVTRAKLYPERCKDACSSEQSIEGFQFSILEGATRFSVSPTPDAGDRYAVEALCTNATALVNQDSDAALPPELNNWMLPWAMLATAVLLMRNRDDPRLIEHANMYFNQFAALTNLSLADVLASTGQQ